MNTQTTMEINGVTPFQFEGRNVRIVEQDGEFWFVAGDVAAELAYSSAPQMTRLLDADEKGVHPVHTPGGEQDVSIVSEAGVYRAIILRRATKKVDERIRKRISRFQRWVFHDVLPSIRRTGSYRAPEVDAMEALGNPNNLRSLLLTYTEKVLELEGTIAEQAPKVDALERLSNADGSLCITDAAKTLQVRPKDLFAFLRSHGWIYSRPGTSDIAYQSKLAQGLLEHKTTTVYRSDGSEKVTTQVRVTAKGLARLAQEFPPVAIEAVAG
ncbi:phage antirepressor KilAC domain-containing protein [Rhodobium gokarnense]|uniref:Prophage antirepressor-like protein n=1 Tax=Rhodobium gokarnense TaxID=364296 RepID=A0ABT3HH91_9HYPH|nr:phage antirepressor KilAC domain-containing protein [Rhodobium gokarnense]MCW2309740.1 prophage antirepressor-like protein [Rhodobium gokarnense]